MDWHQDNICRVSSPASCFYGWLMKTNCSPFLCILRRVHLSNLLSFFQFLKFMGGMWSENRFRLNMLASFPTGWEKGMWKNKDHDMNFMHKRNDNIRLSIELILLLFFFLQRIFFSCFAQIFDLLGLTDIKREEEKCRNEFPFLRFFANFLVV